MTLYSHEQLQQMKKRFTRALNVVQRGAGEGRLSGMRMTFESLHQFMLLYDKNCEVFSTRSAVGIMPCPGPAPALPQTVL